MSGRPAKYWWLLAPVCVFYGAAMVSLTGGIYGVSPYHRIQAAALLRGHLSIGDSLDQMNFGLAWHNGHVQQVWGIGVGIWLAPFQAVWHLISRQEFPDRIALGVAFALLAFYSISTGLRIARSGPRAAGLGFIWLILLCPPLWTLTRSSQLVFEETVLYGLLLCLGMLVALFRMAYFDSRADYFIGCGLAAYSGLIRPTHAIYGLGTVLVCALILRARRKAGKEIALCGCIWIGGLLLLAVTNWIRFGSPVEFGHRLTESNGSMVYLTRFGNPFAGAGTFDASKELFGMLFLDFQTRDTGAFSENLFPGQSPFTRWRRLDLTLFDPSYAVLCSTVIVVALLWLVRRMNARHTGAFRLPTDALVAGLVIWSGLPILGLTGFYLHFLVIASRYLLDFLPAVMALLLLGWMYVSIRSPRISMCLLALWLAYELGTAKVPANGSRGGAFSTDEIQLPHIPLDRFAGAYAIDSHPAQSGIPGNGQGWEPESGIAEDIVILAVDRPEFLELHVSRRRQLNGATARNDVYRAQMGGIALPLREISNEGEEFKVVFDVPEHLRTGQQLLFLCFSQGYEAEDRGSERFLYSVRWK